MTHPALADAAARVRGGGAVVVAGVGSGLTAAGAVRGGADLLAVYNTAAFRQRNLPSILAFLPGHDPNRLTLEAAPAVVANAAGRPVVLGFAAHDPHLRFEPLLDAAEALGAAGVTNEPFVGLYGADFRAELDRAGCGFGRELALIEAAVRRGLVTLGWACDPEEAARVAGGGAGLVGLMLGITGAASDTAALDRAVDALGPMAAAARQGNPEALLLAHGGPLESPEAVAAVLARCDVDGYVTGSSLERGPVLDAVAERTRAFRQVRLRGRDLDARSDDD